MSFEHKHPKINLLFNFVTFFIGFDARWQPVNGTRHKFYVYSAYYDARTRPVIRVIGATKTKRSDKVWCRLHYGQSIEQKVSKSGNGNENGEDQEEEEMPPLLVPGGIYQLFMFHSSHIFVFWFLVYWSL